ncbi:MAG TPA: hypothetical protein VHL11_16850 [Phototrophicaceae bacterium]|jgi:hypothetical protein|nr:hypothetical protein [Phototrophicaceae bacterium]
MVVTRQIGKAMANQVSRVNTDPDYLLERNEELQREVDRQVELIRKLRGQLAKYAEHESTGEELRQRGYVETPKGRFLDGQRVYTVYEAAALCTPRISHWIARRYVIDGYWIADKYPDNNQWLIYAEQANGFVKRPPKKPQRRRQSR